jgi:hypothetical protein
VRYNYFNSNVRKLNFRYLIPLLTLLVSSLSLISAQQPAVFKKNIATDTIFTTVLINNKVHINWAGQNEERISHYIIEKSTDKTDCTDVAMFFTSDLPDRLANEKFSSNTYSYKDQVTIRRNMIVYYRLKIIDKNGVINYSAWQTIEVGKK